MGSSDSQQVVSFFSSLRLHQRIPRFPPSLPSSLCSSLSLHVIRANHVGPSLDHLSLPNDPESELKEKENDESPLFFFPSFLPLVSKDPHTQNILLGPTIDSSLFLPSSKSASSPSPSLTICFFNSSSPWNKEPPNPKHRNGPKKGGEKEKE